MYINFSFKKVGVIAAIGAMLAVAIMATFSLKEARFGTTPFFASVSFGVEESLLRVRYGFEAAARGVKNGALAIFSSGEYSASAARSAKAIPVLTYHRVVDDRNDQNNVTERAFRDQMRTLKNAGWETVTLEEYRAFMAGERELPERSFLITFDDGAKESFYPVDPLLEALGYEGVIYIIVAGSETPESVYYLSPEEIKRMLRTGRWEIGSHSRDGHRPYPTDAKGEEGIFFSDKLFMPEKNRIETEEEFRARVREDLAEAKRMLEETYGVSVTTFAFPLGNEMGFEAAQNFPQGVAITEEEAEKLYDLGFIQTKEDEYSFNYPQNHGFLARRIHVEYDWDGERLLRELENGLPKDLPYEDDFSEDRGWLSAWGEVEAGFGGLRLKAFPDASSASSILDGSYLWENYEFRINARWEGGHAFVLGNVEESRAYDACAFGEGMVQVQRVENGEAEVLAEAKDARIAYGSEARMGIRVIDGQINCLWDGASVVNAWSGRAHGGVGIQVWDPDLGSAELTVHDASVVSRNAADRENGE